jgi:hypothetical protein
VLGLVCRLQSLGSHYLDGPRQQFTTPSPKGCSAWRLAISIRPSAPVVTIAEGEDSIKDGLDVLNEVLVIDPPMRLVLISGHGDSDLRLGEPLTRFHRDGGAEILRKPFRGRQCAACCDVG